MSVPRQHTCEAEKGAMAESSRTGKRVRRLACAYPRPLLASLVGRLGSGNKEGKGYVGPPALRVDLGKGGRREGVGRRVCIWKRPYSSSKQVTERREGRVVRAKRGHHHTREEQCRVCGRVVSCSDLRTKKLPFGFPLPICATERERETSSAARCGV